MAEPLSLYRAHFEVVSFYLETEGLHSTLRGYVNALPRIPGASLEQVNSDVLADIHRASKESGEFMQLNNDDALWLFRRAYAQMSPGQLIRNAYASYHDLAYWVAEGFITDLQFSNNDGHGEYSGSMSHWPTSLNSEGIRVAFAKNEHAFDDLVAIQGYLKLEAAAAANIAPSMAVELTRDAGISDDDLTPRERNILEAIGVATMQAKELAEKSGYVCNSNFRSTLSGLVKRRHLKKCLDGYGYLRQS
ncbi:hypothetical protein [Lacipirellula parvula]|uniref:Uncharacterized protein n=1 Tax=Lacipirellula parvula TaxID=2650471 RepID=A0A5K7X2F8_9BACT|nr:hypothetical protein [Lacipirellula parvula]BBO30834.1 hypothetical protein PLANPX_0446 [Lacipirellula parvula]